MEDERELISQCQKGNKSSLSSVDHNKLTGWIELVAEAPMTTIPNNIKLSFDYLIVTKSDKVETIFEEWDVSFQRDTNNINSKPIEYKGNKFSINVGDRRLDLKVHYTKVYPMMTEMRIDLLTEIKEGIHYVYHLENENGKVFKHIDDGIMTDSGDVLPQFESSYFEPSQKLFLVIDKVVIVGSPEGAGEAYEVNKRIELIK